MANYEVFISYSRKDDEVASRIYDALAAEGITCFIDRQGISGGADFPTVLAEAIMGAKLLLLVASENSYASEFTQKELTFAVSNKGSRFIFPLIVDGSTLPKNLEFLLSNINWRTLSSHYHIEKEMVADVKKKLADPHAGETLKQREKNSLKYLIITFVALIVLAVGTVVGTQLKQQKVEKQAITAGQNCASWLKRSETLIHRADSLRDSRPNFKETFEAEVGCLDEAGALLSQVDSIKNYYELNDPTRAFYVSKYSTSAARSTIQHKRDSMFRQWKQFALDNYRDYEYYQDETGRGIALDYVEKALILRPSDTQLQQIKTTLSPE
jgi:hypothetical protein